MHPTKTNPVLMKEVKEIKYLKKSDDELEIKITGRFNGQKRHWSDTQSLSGTRLEHRWMQLKTWNSITVRKCRWALTEPMIVWGRVKRQKALSQFTPVSTYSAASAGSDVVVFPFRSNGSEVRDVCIFTSLLLFDFISSLFMCAEAARWHQNFFASTWFSHRCLNVARPWLLTAHAHRQLNNHLIFVSAILKNSCYTSAGP